jgi:hypothetical protein
VGPTDREWRRGSLYKGDGEGVLVHGEKEAAGEVFLSSDPLYHCFSGIEDGKGELLKLLVLHATRGRGSWPITCHQTERERDRDRRMETNQPVSLMI